MAPRVVVRSGSGGREQPRQPLSARVGSSGRGGDCDTPESSSSLNSEAKSKAPPSCQFSAFERKPPHRDGRQRQGAAMAMDRYERQGCYSCAGVLSALGVLLMLILLPMTWKKVEYYQGCPRRRPVAPPRLASTVGRHRRVVPTVARRVATSAPPQVSAARSPRARSGGTRSTRRAATASGPTTRSGATRSTSRTLTSA